jgi:hypothetical protein
MDGHLRSTMNGFRSSRLCGAQSNPQHDLTLMTRNFFETFYARRSRWSFYTAWLAKAGVSKDGRERCAHHRSWVYPRSALFNAQVGNSRLALSFETPCQKRVYARLRRAMAWLLRMRAQEEPAKSTDPQLLARE